MTHRKRGFVVGILILAAALTPVAAIAGPLEDARDAVESGDHATALRLLRPLAEQGHADAQTGLGVMYSNGWSVPQDYAEAVKWYQLAAEQGYAEAQHHLGIMYERGLGVPQDYVEAVRWYLAAAEQGHAPAQFSLGVMYHSDLGVPLDDVQALMWFSLAASRFPPGEYYDRAAQGWETLAANMTPAQIAEAEKQARDWRPRGERVQ